MNTTTNTDPARAARINADIPRMNGRKLTARKMMTIARKHAMTTAEVMYVFCISQRAAQFIAGDY